MLIELNDPVGRFLDKMFFSLLLIVNEKKSGKQKQKLLYVKRLGFDCFKIIKPLNVMDVKIKKLFLN